MQISVIGTNGFLSRVLVEFFIEKGYKLHMYGRQAPLQPYTTFTHINLVEEKPDYVKLCLSDIIIYTVGAGIQSNLKEASQIIYNLNVTVPIELCNKLKENHFKGILISFGSVFEIGNTEEERFFDETDILTSLAPASGDYAISKRMLSRFIQAYSREYTHWHFIIPTIYGEAENPARLIPYTIDALKRKQALSFTNGNQTRQYIYVNELPVMIQLALNNNLPGGIYNIEGNEILTVRQLVKMIHDKFGEDMTDDCFGKAVRTDTAMKYLALNGAKLNSFIHFNPTHKIVDVIEKY